MCLADGKILLPQVDPVGGDQAGYVGPIIDKEQDSGVARPLPNLLGALEATPGRRVPFSRSCTIAGATCAAAS